MIENIANLRLLSREREKLRPHFAVHRTFVRLFVMADLSYQSCHKNRYILLTKRREEEHRGSQLRVLKALEGFERRL
jgi:hypothetical protein